MVVIPTPGEAGPAVADTGTGPHYASPETHGEACRRALDRELPPATVVSLAGIPSTGASPAAGHSAHRGDRDNNALDRRRRWSGFQRLGLPGHPDHVDEDERRAWRLAAERQWERLLEMRAVELAPGGLFVAAIPASPAPCPDRTGLYNEVIGDINLLLAEWRREEYR